VAISINVTGDIGGPTIYSYNVNVTLPDSTIYSRTVTLQTSASGVGSVAKIFPTDFPAGSATILDGSYKVHVTQTSPLAFNPDLGTKTFTVTNQIDLTILSPLSTSSFTRGDSVAIITQAKDVQGKPFTGLSVNFTTPANASLALTDPLSTGVYSGQYTIKFNDPLGWRITVNASDAWGNTGSRSVNLLVTSANITVEPLQITDVNGKDLGSTTVNETIYVFFKARYPDGSYVTSGSANVTILAPGNLVMARLNATYSTLLGGFFTPSGFFIQSNQPTGQWFAYIYTDQFDDGATNTGPGTPISAVLNVSSLPFVFSTYLFAPLILLGLGATGSALVLTRKTRSGFEYFTKITGGGIPEGSLVMLYGEAKSGKSLLLEEMLYEQLKQGKPCIYITYELTTQEILKNAGDFKWDLEPFIESGLLTIIDNSDLMASLDLSKTRMKLSSALTLKENRGLHLFIDSMDLLFEDLDYREVKFFLTKLTEEVRKLQGSVYFSLTTSHIIKQTIPEIRDILDWSIELQTKKNGSRLDRVMVIKKLKDTSFKGTNSSFKLVKRRGMVFDVPLIRKLGKG
jgi:KaiC/GvpD/RAD55 family RecA-like ATPase